MWLFFLFIGIPMIEIGLFIQVGGWLGLWPTLLIVLLTALAGSFLVRQQGAAAMAQLRGSFQTLQDPSQPLAEGAMILFAGALLLTPGFFTDTVGLLLLVPRVRVWLFKTIKARVQVQRFEMGGGFDPRQGSAPGRGRDGFGGTTIDGEYQPVDPENADARQIDTNIDPSKWTRH